jgi:hypothetical protein
MWPREALPVTVHSGDKVVDLVVLGQLIAGQGSEQLARRRLLVANSLVYLLLCWLQCR